MSLWTPFRAGMRSISSSTRACQHYVSNIGKQPIKVPPNVTLRPNATSLSVEGPLGKTSVFLHPFVRLKFVEEDALEVSVETPSEKKQRSMWGTTRTLIYNAVVGMTEGYTMPLYLVGVGYRAALEEDPRGTVLGGGVKAQRLNMKLGYSHSVFVPIPPHIKAEVPLATKIVLSCTDKQKLGLFTAQVRALRKPEPYKGKGIFVGTEQIRIKTVKKK